MKDNASSALDSARRTFGVLRRQGLYLWLSMGSLLFASAAFAQTNRAVTLELQCAAQPTLTEIHITLRNAGNTGTAVVLGTRLGNIYLAKTLSLEARFGDTGQIERFTFDNPLFSNSTGREDPWIVPLPAHSAYVLSISGQHFLSATSGRRLDEVAALADIQLHLAGSKIEPLNLDTLGLANWDVLVMDMQSALIAVPEDCVE